MATIYQGSTAVTITEPTEVIPVAGRIIHVQTPAGVWLCGNVAKNNVILADQRIQAMGFKHCPKCAKRR